MKIYIYSEHQNWIEHSGVGRAIYHQKNAISKISGIELTENKEAADVIHINTIFPGSVIMALWAKRHGKKVVFHAHSTKEDFRNSFVGSNAVAGLFGKWIRFCYQLGDVVVTPSEYARELLQSQGMNRPIYVMSNGIDLEYYQRQADDRKNFRAKYGYSQEDKVIMSAGLWIRRKGILDFIEMAKQLPEYQFIWFGDSSLWSVPKEIRKAIRSQNHLPNLRFAGYVPKKNLRQAYAGSDLFWFPSYEETEGIVVLEALTMKIPVLLRDIPVYQGWLANGQNAYTFHSPEQAAQKIIDICEGNVPDLTKNGYQVAVERSMNQTGKKLQEIYQLALERISYSQERVLPCKTLRRAQSQK